MIHTSTNADRSRVLDTPVLGLSVDPLFRWYFPKAHEYLANVPTFLQLIGGDAFENKMAFHMEDFVCSAL